MARTAALARLFSLEPKELTDYNDFGMGFISPSDKKIIEAFLRGEAASHDTVRAWVVLAVRCGRLGRALQADRDDIVQEVLLKIFNNLRQSLFTGQSSLKTYVYRIAQNTCIDYWRAKRRSPAMDTPPEDAPDPVEVRENPYEVLVRIEKQQLFAEALRRASEECRRLWRMIFEERLLYRDIAAALSTTEDVIKQRVLRCKRKLVETLQEIQAPRDQK